MADYGIDVSHHQGDVDWHAVKSAGIRFAWAKVDGDRVDEYWPRNRAGARSVGIPIGGYHFIDANANPIAQAEGFRARLQQVPGMLPPALDVEANGGRSPAHLHWWVHQFRAALGMPLVIYTGDWFWRPCVAAAGCSACASMLLWISGYTSDYADVPIPSPWTFATVWQYTNARTIPGSHTGDANVVMRGNVSDLLRYVNRDATRPDSNHPRTEQPEADMPLMIYSFDGHNYDRPAAYVGADRRVVASKEWQGALELQKLDPSTIRVKNVSTRVYDRLMAGKRK